jgi:hypothetical protein
VLATLRRHGVRFVLVGGVAAVIEGAPIATFDLGVVPDREARNIDRLVEALAELKARYRGRRRLRPAPDALRGPGHHLLMTRCGPLDILGVIGKERDFRALLPHSRRACPGRYISACARSGNADRGQRGNGLRERPRRRSYLEGDAPRATEKRITLVKGLPFSRVKRPVSCHMAREEPGNNRATLALFPPRQAPPERCPRSQSRATMRPCPYPFPA